MALIRTYRRGREQDVVRAPGREFHSVAPSRGGQGLHLWHGERLYRLRGRPEKVHWGDLGDPLLVVMLPVALVIGALDRAQERKAAVRVVLGLLGPVVGPRPPGVRVRPPLPGLPTAVLRVLVRVVVIAAVLAGLVLLALYATDRLDVS